jgi:ABC-2 type transport system permease protein
MILGNAVRAEIFKLRRDRATLFWAFGLTPIVTLAGGVVIEAASRMAGASIAPADPVGAALGGLAAAGNPLVQLLLIIGAAVVFAGEYGWKTWRSILPRSERTALLLAKFVTFMAAAALSVALCGLAGFVSGLFEAAILGMPLAWPAEAGGAVLAVLLSFAASVLQLLVIAGLVATAAICTRSMLAASTGPFMLLVGLELVATRISLPDASLATALMPNIAARALREMGVYLRGDADAVGLHLAVPGAAALLVWSALLIVAAVALFRRQDLAEE